MNIFEVLSNNDRVIVHSDYDTNTVYTWNRSVTLQRWSVEIVIDGTRDNSSYELEVFDEVGVRNSDTEIESFEEAVKAAKKWHDQLFGFDRDDISDPLSSEYDNDGTLIDSDGWNT